jgi:hypothetical protein
MGRQVGRAWKATKEGRYAAWEQTRERRRRMGRGRRGCRGNPKEERHAAGERKPKKV